MGRKINESPQGRIIVMHQPFISICIPAYKRTAYLKRVLDSIAVQTYRHFEVIVTDDTPGNELADFIKNLPYDFPLIYIHNDPAKGTPLNWTEGMKHAKGEWIKIIHDDDWLTDADALQHYADAIREGVDCIFSGYVACYEAENRLVNKTITQKKFQRIQRHPHELFASNQIGPPSVVLFRKTMGQLYDPQLKWLVDLEAYVTILQKFNCVYIDRPLITMSYNETQVTNDCFRNPEVEIRESLIYYQKHGDVVFSTWVGYDGWWRLLRNLEIRSVDQLKLYSKDLSIPDTLHHILIFQKQIPAGVLKVGVFSKIFMFVSYTVTFFRGFHHHH